ncbi:hypothetical protein DFJ58DRAFT_821168 [Suillus subalutaceus]|uniref:uncharacterized protein n=1 Tax=Suillus subalutaceus TaxID=48586 RepID=UPI001B872030|nr:uncharacterized protein DFJ58DRAFT_821168 [Suillus subalutaceus]KAG1834936.1 hypothetical protein DFJ58DRAFT_821168 [Suillus subalutaceus]
MVVASDNPYSRFLHTVPLVVATVAHSAEPILCVATEVRPGKKNCDKKCCSECRYRGRMITAVSTNPNMTIVKSLPPRAA